jgi:hypothetical protein
MKEQQQQQQTLQRKQIEISSLLALNQIEICL